MYGSMGDHMPPAPEPEGEGESLPTPQDNPFCCPVCGFCPCSDGCGLGLTEFDLEDLDLMWRDWGAEADADFDFQEDDVDEQQA
jgi:hypothetical protein